MAPNTLILLRDIATLACITALAIAGVISGSTAVALLGPYLALRALMSRKGGGDPPEGGAGAGGAAGGEEPPKRIGFQGIASAGSAVAGAVLLACAKMFDPFAELELLVAGAEDAHRRFAGLFGAEPRVRPARLPTPWDTAQLGDLEIRRPDGQPVYGPNGELADEVMRRIAQQLGVPR